MGLLTKKIINFFPHPFGLDLSDLSIKVVQLDEEGRGDRVIGYGEAAIAPRSVADGEILNADAVAEAIRKAIANAHPRPISTKRVVCSLPETKAFLRIITIPRMEEEEAREAVKWEMEANIPLPIDQVYYDWQILEDPLFAQDRKKMSVLVVAVARKVVDQFVDILQKVGLTVVGLEIESIAQARGLLADKEDSKTTMIVDVGDRRTSFLISTHNIPCFTSSVPLSGESFTDAIAKALGLSNEEAEKTKITYGIGSAIKNDHIFHAVESVLENLITEIKKSMDFYVTGLQYAASVDQIILCGGGSKTKGLVPYLSQRLGKDIILGNPWVNFDMGKNLPVMPRDTSIQFSTAIGLALKELHYDDLA